MTTIAQRNRQASLERPIDEGRFEDLTARARIREAALSHFAQEGYEQATIRSIAHTAGVSHGMLRHHFGSKVALRAACDNYVFEILHTLNSLTLTTPNMAAHSFRTARRLWCYAARSLADGSPTAAPIFDEMVTLTERWLMAADDLRPDQPSIGGRSRPALVAAMAIGIPLVREHLIRAAGVDVFTTEGEQMVGEALLGIDALEPIGDNVETAPATSEHASMTQGVPQPAAP